MKLIYSILIVVFLYSCGNENTDKVREDREDENTESASDTLLTPEEVFSSSLVQEILDEDDEELQIYLEEEFFTVASKSPKVTIDKISSSQYIFSFESDSIMKNFLIQKFYIPAKDEFIFEKREIDFNTSEKLLK
ncbi:MAG: hypothetical protein HGGPFJEG_01993 [Ignavibacteria bacterium]|nr:hypothetical protein [Ignavibacteria bacterium]